MTSNLRDFTVYTDWNLAPVLEWLLQEIWKKKSDCRKLAKIMIVDRENAPTNEGISSKSSLFAKKKSLLNKNGRGTLYIAHPCIENVTSFISVGMLSG